MLRGRLLENRFRVGRLLGRGGQGDVYQAEDGEHPGLALVVKVFRSDPEVPDHRAAFFQEMRYALGLRHPNLLEVHGSGLLLPECMPYYVGEYVEGIALNRFFSRERGVETVAAVALQILAALDHLHRSGLLHLDVKPSNVLIREKEGLQIKLIDYGALRQKGLRKGLPPGAIRYMSPRVVRGREPRESDDIVSLGFLVYEWFVGQLPLADLSNEDYLGRLALGGELFARSDFSACQWMAPWVRTALEGKFTGAQEASRALKRILPSTLRLRGDKGRVDALVLPQPQPSKGRQFTQIVRALSQALDGGIDGQPLKRAVIVSGVRGIGKSTLVEQAAYRLAEEKNCALQFLPAMPQNSVMNTLRVLSERFEGLQAFSGHDPLATSQRLLSLPYRQQFFEAMGDRIADLARRLHGLVLLFDSVSSHDLFFLELVRNLAQAAEKRKAPLALVLTSDDPAFEKGGRFENRAGFENIHLERLFSEVTGLQIFMKPWSPRAVERHLRLMFRQVPAGISRELRSHHLATPGEIRGFIEGALMRRSLYVGASGKWLYRKSRRLPRPATAAGQAPGLPLEKIFPFLPVPVTQSVLAPFFRRWPEQRRTLVRLIQNGTILKDEERYHWRENRNPTPATRDEIQWLRELSQEEAAYLLVLCQLDPHEDHAERLLRVLDGWADSDRYLPCSASLTALVKALAPKSRSRGALLYHIARIQSMQGKIRAAERTLRGITRHDVSDRLWFQICLERSNVLAKKGALKASIGALGRARSVALQAAEMSFVDWLTLLTRSVLRGPSAFPIAQLEQGWAALERNDLAGRLALRYAQALLWAGLAEEAAAWIDRAISGFTRSGQRYRLARALRMKARICRDRGELQAAIEMNEQSLATLQELWLPQEEIETVLALFYLHHRLAHQEVLEDYLARVARLIPLLPDSQYELVWPELVALARQEKDPQAALQCYRDKEKLARTCRSREHLYVALRNQAHLEQLLGNADRSRVVLRRAESIFERYGRLFPPRLQRSHQSGMEPTKIQLGR